MALPWVAIAQVGLGLLSQSGTDLQRAQYKAQRTLDKAEYKAKETIRAANNELGAAQSSLSNWMRSVNNKRTIDAAGEAYNAAGENLSRMWQQSTTGSLQRRVQASEQLGAIQASAAAAGVGGSTVDLINGTLKLRNAMLNAEIEKQEGQATYDQLMQRAGVMDNGYAAWDHSFDSANMDYMSAQMPLRIEPAEQNPFSWQNLLGAATKIMGANKGNNSVADAFSRGGDALWGQISKLFSGGTAAGPVQQSLPAYSAQALPVSAGTTIRSMQL